METTIGFAGLNPLTEKYHPQINYLMVYQYRRFDFFGVYGSRVTNVHYRNKQSFDGLFIYFVET